MNKIDSYKKEFKDLINDRMSMSIVLASVLFLILAYLFSRKGDLSIAFGLLFIPLAIIIYITLESIMKFKNRNKKSSSRREFEKITEETSKESLEHMNKEMARKYPEQT